ncbi:MocR-like pyridoxine biosynthesis transcription factor PdxR [Microbulbifer hainanensis]|uniref:MocR-like pyridoxine biosynthesis transcription factor PdxR n=1 Tax=Microbulbifer hainanensis TaxID=2735675 RepID=UPI0018683628|nr:PLP-dependent aminotransferase family protein [Microbulbifer hainanensis]
MKSVSGIPFSAVVFDSHSETPRYRQLYAFIRDLVLNGTLPAGVRLPSSRELAAELAVSRNTVIAAYEMLVDEQFAESAVGRGTVVRNTAMGARAIRNSAAPRVETAVAAEAETPLRMGFALPDAEHFPSPDWLRVLRAAVRQAQPANRRPPLAGDLQLRKLVSAYLGAYRGVRCSAKQVLITSGGQQGLYLAAAVLRQLSAQIYVEDPGYLGARQAFTACGFRLLPLPVDENGIRFADALAAPEGDTRAVYLTPSHQFPLGVALSLERRLEILDWAVERNGWIIEDDYDAEYRYRGEPLTALAGLDRAQRVIYVGTFSKVLSPELCVGYAVVPESLLPQFRAAKAYCSGAGAGLVQRAIADFIRGGYFLAHLRHMRELYRDKRDRFLRALQRRSLPVTVSTPPHGMHITLKLENHYCDREVARQMVARGFEALALSKHYLEESSTEQGLVVGFTNASDEDFADFADTLGDILQHSLAACGSSSS